MSKITRIEVIEKGERKYVKWNCKVTESIQDNGRTLKLFVEEKPIKKYKCIGCKKTHEDRDYDISQGDVIIEEVKE